ncbi:MAG TPA: alpha/beta hydrolase-fold protein [Steroidobacteraceae bacterium]
MACARSIVCRFLALISLCGCAGAWAHAEGPPPWRFEVSIPGRQPNDPVTGRLIVAIARQADPEPRMLIGMNGPALVGADIEQLQPGASTSVDVGALTYPYANLRDLPAGDYFLQAVLIRYRQVKRSDGHVIWVPTAHRRIPFTTLPGNLYSRVQQVHLDPQVGLTLPLELSQTVPPLEEPKDTPYLRHLTLQSKLLTRFWGTPVFLRATVLLPRGYAEHPTAHYPLVFPQSQGETPFYFNEDAASQAEELGNHAANVQTGYEFFQSWIADDFPRMIVVLVEESSPYFLEAYSVDSANNGPYGAALTQEMLPFLEKQFRLIGKSYARVTEGASTGGWEALALQLYYPDYFGGAWVFNPDPISFQHYQQMDIYKDDNAFVVPMSPFLNEERPMRRTVEGQVTLTLRQLARLEAVLGGKGRSGYQLDAWQSVHGPVDAQGYPAQLFDKRTGKIDHSVAEYMRAHGYDLTEYTRANWATLGPKLVGKLNFFSGEMDNFYLNLAVYDYQDMLRASQNPHYEGRFEFGRPKQGHSWHLTDFARMLREMSAAMVKNAPAGEDTAQWHY